MPKLAMRSAGKFKYPVIMLCCPFQHENVDESSLKQDASEECKLLMSSGCTIEENEGGNNEDSLKMVCAATNLICYS